MSGLEYGTVIEVSTLNEGTVLTADAAIGATTLFLYDASIFEESGGQISVPAPNATTQYLYLSVDVDLNTMTLAPGGLTAAVATDDRVEIWPPAPVRTAMVKFGIEDAEAVRVTIPHFFSGLPDGIRVAGDQEIALVEERKPGELYLKDIMAEGMSLLFPGDDIDLFTSQGVFIQLHSADASTALHYPVPYAGVLEVLATLPADVMVQRYTAYRNAQLASYPSTWSRSFGDGVWSAWVALANDTGDISSTGSIAVAQSGWSFTSGHLRQIGKIVSIQLFFTYTGAGITVPASGDIGNTPVCQMVAAYRPGLGYSQGGLSTINSGRTACFSMDTAGIIYLSSVGGSTNIATNDAFSVGGQYLMN